MLDIFGLTCVQCMSFAILQAMATLRNSPCIASANDHAHVAFMSEPPGHCPPAMPCTVSSKQVSARNVNLTTASSRMWQKSAGSAIVHVCHAITNLSLTSSRACHYNEVSCSPGPLLCFVCILAACQTVFCVRIWQSSRVGSPSHQSMGWPRVLTCKLVSR